MATRTQRQYTGKAAKVNEQILKLEAELKAKKAELKELTKEQMKAERAAAARARRAALAAEKKEKQEKLDYLYNLIEASGKTPEEVISMLEEPPKTGE